MKVDSASLRALGIWVLLSPPFSAQATEHEPADVVELPALPPRAVFDEILERPLFSESRRPEANAGNAELTSARELRETWKLTGVVMVGEEQKALLQERTGDRRLVLTTGMPLDASWMLEEISPTHVVMGAGDEMVRLELLEPRDTQPVAVPEAPIEEAPDAGNSATNNDEVRTLEERAQEATRRLQQAIQQNTEAGNE